MASIQASINQLSASLLGAAFVGTQSPALKDKIATKNRLNRLQKQQELLTKAEGVGELPFDKIQELRAKRLEAAEQAFEVSPSEETYKAMAEAQKVQPTIVSAYESPMDYYGSEDYQQEIDQEAENRLYQQKREADILSRLQGQYQERQGIKDAVKQRRSFVEAMKGEQVRFGKGEPTTFGELDPKLQKQIAQQYSKGERKKVMDKYYGTK